MNRHSDAQDITRLRVLGVRMRYSKRADCPLCKGSSTGTLAFAERLWRGYRCNEGGDAFTLVRAVNRCVFPDALRYVADLAGIRSEDRASVNLRRELAAHKQKRERVEGAADKLEALARALRLECRERIHDAERKRLRFSERLAALARGERERFRGEQEALWLIFQAAGSLLNTDTPAINAAPIAGKTLVARLEAEPKECLR